MNETQEAVDTRTIHGRLIDEGFYPLANVPVQNISSLITYLEALNEEKDRMYHIVPDDKAIEGSGWTLEGPGHIFYIQCNEGFEPPHPSFGYIAERHDRGEQTHMNLLDERLYYKEEP